MPSKHYLRQVMKCVYFRLTCSLPVLNMGSKHLRQLKKFVYSRSNYSLPVLNIGSKHYSLQVIKFV